jgi:hypothetical protein
MTSKKRGNISMDLRDCYNSFGGDFDEVLGRLRREQTVRKFVYKFLDDKSFDLFEAAMRDRDYGGASGCSYTQRYLSESFIWQVICKQQPYDKGIKRKRL